MIRPLAVITLGAVCAAGLCAAAPAHAQDSLAPRVLVIPLDGKGPVPARLSGVIVRAATGRGARASLAETHLAETSLLVGCDPGEAACLDAMASALNIDHLVFGTVRRQGRETLVELTVTARERTPLRASFVLADGRAGDDRVSSEVVRMLTALELEARAADAEPPPPAAAPPTPPTVAPPPPRGPPPARSRGAPLWTWSMVVGGAALAAAGGGLWATGTLQQGDIDDAPVDTAAQLSHLRDIEDGAELRLRIGGAMAIAGAVTTVAGVVLVVRHRHAEPAAVAAVPVDRTDAALGVVPLAGGAGVVVRGRF